MWVSRIRFSSENTLIGTAARISGVSALGFPLSYSYTKDCIIVHLAGTMLGTSKDNRRFLKQIKSNPRLIKLESKNDFVIATIKEPLHTKPVYSKDIIHIEPALISANGYELLNIASFQRQKIVRVANVFIKKYSGELLSIRQQKISTISVTTLQPTLSPKQKEAMRLAIDRGYYEVPRKTNLKELAKLAKLSFSTFQVHLRKAEMKLIPNYFR